MTNSKIFGIGLSKTGTTSLYTALGYLGYRSGTYKHISLLGLKKWFDGDFSYDYLKEYDSVTDLPITGFYKELDKRYPHSKFILTIRDISPWLDSCASQFQPNRPKKKKKKRVATKEEIEFGRQTNKLVYQCEDYNEQLFSLAFNRHHEGVLSYFKSSPEKLLVIDFFAGEGWKELCEFLDKEIPNKPFPNVKPGFRYKGDPIKMIEKRKKRERK